MEKSSKFVALVAAAGVLAAAGLLVLIVLLVQEQSAEATSPGKPGKIAYSAYDGTNVAIYTIDPGGGNRFKVTDKPGYARNPAYSPTGNKIAYSGHDGNDSEIYTIDPGEGEPLKVTDNDTDDLYPSYSPSGQTIAYVGYPPQQPGIRRNERSDLHDKRERRGKQFQSRRQRLRAFLLAQRQEARLSG
jgi:Tol biopolymer transport system component